MIDDFFDYLQNATSPEQYNVFRNAFDLLLNMDTDSYSSAIASMYSTFHTKDTITNTDEVFGFLGSALKTELGAKFAIYIDDDILPHEHLEKMVLILQGTYGIDRYFDPEELKMILEATIDKEEAFAEIIISVTGSNQFSAGELMEIYEVSNSLIKRIESILRDLTIVSVNVVDNPVNQHGVNRTKKYLEVYPSLLIDRLFKAGLKIGDSYNNYLDYLYNYLVEEKNSDVIVRALVGCCVMAGIPNNKIKEFLSMNIESIFLESDRLLSIGRAITNFVLVEENE